MASFGLQRVDNLTLNKFTLTVFCLQKRPKFLENFRNPCWEEAGRLRCLPYFHIIGVCKTGTTDLFERLSRHPQIIKNYGILGKETWYWTWKRYGHGTDMHFISVFQIIKIKSQLKTLTLSFDHSEQEVNTKVWCWSCDLSTSCSMRMRVFTPFLHVKYMYNN